MKEFGLGACGSTAQLDARPNPHTTAHFCAHVDGDLPFILLDSAVLMRYGIPVAIGGGCGALVREGCVLVLVRVYIYQEDFFKMSSSLVIKGVFILNIKKTQ